MMSTEPRSENETFEQAARRLLQGMDARKQSERRSQNSRYELHTGQTPRAPGSEAGGAVCPRLAFRLALILDAANDDWPWVDGLEL
jgi:hypothetical protein